MENLTINDAAGAPPQQQDGNTLGAGNAPPQGAPQLPPQMFTTAAQLLDLTDSMLFNPALTLHSESCHRDTKRYKQRNSS